MRTENDLRAALRDRADQAPEPSLGLIEHAIAGPARPRLRASLSIAAAVVTVTALISIPVAVSGHLGQRAKPAPVAQSAAAPSRHAVVSPMSWATESLQNKVERDLLPDWESLTIPVDGARLQLVDFAPKVFDPSKIIDPQPVTIDGQAGFFGQISSTPATPADWPKPTAFGNPRPSLAWQLGADRWVVLAGDSAGFKTKAGLLAVVPKLGAQLRTTPVLLPIKFGYLPAGLILQAASLSGTGPHLAGFSYLSLQLSDSHGQNLFITMLPQAGLPATANPQRKIGNYELHIQGTFSRSTMQRVLDSATLAARPSSENSSWFSLGSALP